MTHADTENGSVVSKGQPIGNCSEHNYALLVIDIQEATTGEFSMYPFFKKNSDDLIKNINQIAETLEKVLNKKTSPDSKLLSMSKHSMIMMKEYKDNRYLGHFKF